MKSAYNQKSFFSFLLCYILCCSTTAFLLAAISFLFCAFPIVPYFLKNYFCSVFLLKRGNRGIPGQAVGWSVPGRGEGGSPREGLGRTLLIEARLVGIESLDGVGGAC